MKVIKEIKKIDMIVMMLNNNYPNAWRYASWRLEKKSRKESYEWAKNYMQYHILKEDIYVMFRNYLYWKIKNN